MYSHKLGKRESGNMDILKKCPKCNSELKMNSDNVQVCSVCKYWTKKGTARLDSITIFA